MYLAGCNRSANWIEYGINQVDDIDKSWEIMMKYSSYLDSKCISLLADIKEDSLMHFFRTMRGLYKSVHIGEMNGFDKLFLDFWSTIQEQDKYYNDVFAIYNQQ